jgi:outer membrane protein assembly factor BamB
MSRSLALFVGLAYITSPLVAQESGLEWPQFRGPGGFGVSADKGVPVEWSATKNLVWKTDLPGPGTSSPVVVGSKIFLTCYTGYNVPGQGKGEMSQLKLHLLCLNKADGAITWTKDIEPKLPEQATIRDGHGYASSTPVADAERVYAYFGKTGVFAFDHAGKQLWQVDVGDRLNGWGSAASPVVVGDLLIVNASVESDTLFALDKKTGKEVWRVKGIRESWNTPILNTVGGKTELVVAVPEKLLAFDPTTGKQLWSCNTDIRSYMSPTLVAADGVVYCVGGRTNGSLAVTGGGSGDVTRTHRLWTSKKGSNVSSPIVHDGHLYWMNDKSETAFCVEAKTGQVVYEEVIGRAGQVYGSPVLADGKLYYPTRTGKVVVLAAKPQFEKLAVNEPLDRSTCNASPAVVGGKLYLRSDKALYCLGTK